MEAVTMTRGGRREGSGRKPRLEKLGKPPKVILSCRVEQETFDRLAAESGRTGKSTGEIVDHLIETHRPDDHLPDKPQEETE